MNTSITTKTWDVRQVWFVVILYFFFEGLVHLFFPSLRQLFPLMPDIFIGFHLATLVFVIINAYFLYSRGGLTLSDVLIQKRDFIILGLGLLILFLTMEIIWGPPSIHPGPYQEVRSLTNFQLVIFLLETILVGPFLEELLYRKYFLEILRSKFSLVFAVFITMLIETSFHYDYDFIGLVYVFFWAMISSIIYLNSRLGVSFCIHSAHNGLFLLFSLGPFYPLR
jgi:membrane protease YdiL (CAAX protease family)